MNDAIEFETFEDYIDSLRGKKSLSAGEYLALLTCDLDGLREYYAETYAQYRSEVAMFGDAGPGQGIVVSDLRKQIAEYEAKIARLRRIVANQSAA